MRGLVIILTRDEVVDGERLEQRKTLNWFDNLLRKMVKDLSGRRNGLALSRTTFQHLVKIDIKFHPYVIIRRQKLREGDPAQ